MILFIFGMISWILLIIDITFPYIVCAWMIIILKTLIGRAYYISMVIHTLMETFQVHNNYSCALFNAKCLFEEHSSDKQFFMKRKTSRFSIVHAIPSLSHSNELLINYNFQTTNYFWKVAWLRTIFRHPHLGQKKKV